MRPPLGVTAARGVGILVGRTLVLQLLTAGVTLVLARLLSPADYGLFAIAAAAQALAQAASGVGISAALIRLSDDPDPEQQRAVTGFLFVTGLGFAVLATVLAFAVLPPLDLGGEAVRVTAVAAVAIPIYAIRAVPMVMLERHLRFGRVAAVETAETLGFNAFALAAALAGLGAFSLAGAIPLAALAGAVVARSIGGAAPGLSFDFAPVRPLAHFGLRASGLRLGNLAKGLGFVTLVSAIGGTSVTGFYAMAERLFTVPTALASAIQRVSFPALSRSQSERPRRAARAAALSAALASLPLALLAGASQALVTVLLGDRWLPTVDLILTAAPGMLLGASAIPAMTGLALSQGRTRGPLVAVAGSAVVLAGVSAVAIPGMDTTGVGIALSASAVTTVAILGFHSEREMRAAVAPVLRALAVGAVAAVAGYLVPVSDSIAGLALRLGLTGAVWGALGALVMRPELPAALKIAWPIVPERLRAAVARYRGGRM
ncbi:MAG TPA: oligosaccharide flippase family protein [Solirubrobacterales bacterium]|nr:oligosaccharide flippase family protein [Solirubrobacterales bacterium]